MGIMLLSCLTQISAPRLPVGPDALMNLQGLPLLRTGTWFVGTSSHDVTGDNNDGFDALYSYLYRDGDEYVLFEEEGPGCVYVVRTIGHKGNLHVYIDRSGKPAYSIPFADLYSGQKSPFVRPFVGAEDEAHGSSWSYVPIPFADYCKLTTDEMEKPHFLNIFAHKYAKDTPVEPFDPDLALDEAAEWWSMPAPLLVSGDSQKLHKTQTIPAHGQFTVLDSEGAGAITGLKIRFPNGSALAQAGKLRLRAYWDGRVAPYVDSPLSTFFALGCPRALDAANHGKPENRKTERYIDGTVSPNSLLVGEGDDGWLYSNFPMPYWKTARLDLLNSSSEEIEIEYEIISVDQPYPQETGYFHALWRQETPLRPGEDYCIVDTRGHGHYVGCVVTFSGVQGYSPYEKNEWIRGYLEGDARFYIDDNRTPLVASTGTEEYFNWGWYDILKHDSVFQYPTHGYPVHVVDDQDHSVMYRFHFSEVVPYYRAFRFELEHGPIGTWPADYSSTAFFYQKDSPRLALTDEIDVGDGASEEAHAYSCEGAGKEVRHALPYEGSYQLPKAGDMPVDRGHTFKDGGRVWNRSSGFTVAIAPKNEGVKLRRRSYYGFGSQGELGKERKNPVATVPQRVKVSVDGRDVGDWYVPAGHARATWRETEFEIPSEFTKGKTRLSIALRAEDGAQWDEYTYWVYTYTAEPTAKSEE